MSRSPKPRTTSHESHDPWYSPLRSYCESQKMPWKSTPVETLLEKKTFHYLHSSHGGSTIREEESSSLFNPYFTDSDRELVVETETLILRNADKTQILNMNPDDEDQEEFMYKCISPEKKNLFKNLSGMTRAPMRFIDPQRPHKALRLKRHTAQLHLTHQQHSERNECMSTQSCRNMDSRSSVDETASLLIRNAPSGSSPSNELRDTDAYKSKMRRIICTVFLLLLSCMALLTLIILLIQPLSEISFQVPITIDGKLERYSFNMTLEAMNSNLVDITVEKADLDVLASAGLIDTATYNSTLESEELLGHVKLLEKPVIFQAMSQNNVSLEISIPKPRNTIGKLIYLMLPYTLHVRGSLLYSSFANAIEYKVPICLFYWVEGPHQILRRPCPAKTAKKKGA